MKNSSLTESALTLFLALSPLTLTPLIAAADGTTHSEPPTAVVAAETAPQANDPFSKRCSGITDCVAAVSEILGQRYVYDGGVQGSLKATPNLTLNRDNAEVLFTYLLHSNGYSRVPLGSSQTYSIQKERDARDSAIPMVMADSKRPPELPNNWDMYTMIYHADNTEYVDELARLSRSFMPANSRIIPIESSGGLAVTDNAANLRKIYDILRNGDVRPTPSVKKRLEEREKISIQERLIRANHESSQQKVPQPAPETTANPTAPAPSAAH